MEQNSVMIENMERKPTDGINEQPTETSLSTTNDRRILTPDLSSFLTSVKNFEMLKMGKETGMDQNESIFSLNFKWTVLSESERFEEKVQYLCSIVYLRLSIKSWDRPLSSPCPRLT